MSHLRPKLQPATAKDGSRNA